MVTFPVTCTCVSFHQFQAYMYNPKMPSCDLEVCDIEDAIRKDDLTPNDRITPRGAVLPKARIRSTRNNVNESPVGDSVIPGTQTIYVRTWGCSHNNSDGEYMAGQLAAYGYKITGTVINVILHFCNKL